MKVIATLLLFMFSTSVAATYSSTDVPVTIQDLFSWRAHFINAPDTEPTDYQCSQGSDFSTQSLVCQLLSFGLDPRCSGLVIIDSLTSSYTWRDCSKYDNRCHNSMYESCKFSLTPDGTAQDIAYSSLWHSGRKLPPKVRQITKSYFRVLLRNYSKWLEGQFQQSIYRPIDLEMSSSGECSLPENIGAAISLYMATYSNNTVTICEQVVLFALLPILKQAGSLKAKIEHYDDLLARDMAYFTAQEYENMISDERARDSFFNFHLNLEFTIFHELTHALVQPFGEQYADCMATAYMKKWAGGVDHGVWRGFQELLESEPGLLGEMSEELQKQWFRRFELFEKFDQEIKPQAVSCEKYKNAA